MSPRTIDVNVPPGARDGSVVKLPGQGLPASGGERGDLYVKLRILAHPIFSVTGDDTIAEVDIAPWEAVLGATIEVPTIDGKAEIKISETAQVGQRLRLREQGLNKRGGGRGDAYIKLRIVAPASPTEREKQLYRELAEIGRPVTRVKKPAS